MKLIGKGYTSISFSNLLLLLFVAYDYWSCHSFLFIWKYLAEWIASARTSQHFKITHDSPKKNVFYWFLQSELVTFLCMVSLFFVRFSLSTSEWIELTWTHIVHLQALKKNTEFFLPSSLPPSLPSLLVSTY